MRTGVYPHSWRRLPGFLGSLFQTCQQQAGATLPPRRLVPGAALPPRRLAPGAALPPTSFRRTSCRRAFAGMRTEGVFTIRQTLYYCTFVIPAGLGQAGIMKLLSFPALFLFAESIPPFCFSGAAG